MDKIRILFVCMGNICRSPTAHGVFQRVINAAGLDSLVEIDSAGTHGYHVGEPPDRRSQEAALAAGVDLSSLRARQVRAEDFTHFHFILAMDRDNFRDLFAMCPDDEGRERIHLFMDFAERYPEQRELPDPYYGGEEGFQRVLDMVMDASSGLLRRIQEEIARF